MLLEICRGFLKASSSQNGKLSLRVYKQSCLLTEEMAPVKQERVLVTDHTWSCMHFNSMSISGSRCTFLTGFHNS